MRPGDPESRRPTRVLLAEDDPAMRALVAAGLRRRGFEVIEACDGRQLADALAGAIAAGRLAALADIVVTDEHMPGPSGLEVLESIRGRAVELPVIVLTAFGSPFTRLEAARLRARLLEKPFEIEALAEQIRMALGGAPKRSS